MTEWQKAMTALLEEYRWQWFASLTFRPYFTIGQRKARLRRWKEQLKADLGTSDFNFIAIPELGRTGDDYHYHALVGGLRRDGAAERLEWMKRWWKLGGDALIELYIPNRGGITYVLKDVGPEDFDEIEFELSSHTRLQSKFIK